MGHTQCTRCEKLCDQVKKIWGAFSEKENQLRFPKPCIVVRKTDVLVCKCMIDLNVFKGIKPDKTEGNLCKLICAGWVFLLDFILDLKIAGHFNYMYLERVSVHALLVLMTKSYFCVVYSVCHLIQ